MGEWQAIPPPEEVDQGRVGMCPRVNPKLDPKTFTSRVDTRCCFSKCPSGKAGEVGKVPAFVKERRQQAASVCVESWNVKEDGLGSGKDEGRKDAP